MPSSLWSPSVSLAFVVDQDTISFFQVGKNKHRTMHHVQTDEVMVPLFAKSPSGQKTKYKYVAGARNYTTVEWDGKSGDLVFEIRVEKVKGYGETEG